MLALLALSALSGVNAQYGDVEYRYDISYWIEREGSARPGGSFIIINNFANAGNVYMRITRIVVTLGSSEFSPASGLPLNINLSQTVRLNMTIQVPSSTSFGITTLTAKATFQYHHPEIGHWITPSDSPIVVSDRILVEPTSTAQLVAGLAGTIAPYAAGTYIVLVGIAAVLIVRERRKPRSQSSQWRRTNSA